MKKLFVACLLVFAGLACSPENKPQNVPTTRMTETQSGSDVDVPASSTAAPEARAGEDQLLRPKSNFGYGQESFRVVSQPDEIVSVFKNGLTVIVKRVPSPVMAVRGYVKTGGIYEGKWLGGGLSHLLEHLVAGGSSERRTEGENRNLLQQIGNNSNAYTTDDHTAYFINTTPPHLDQAVDLLTGWLFGAKILEEEYRREYLVVQRELEKGKGEPGRQFYYLAMSNRYKVHPARVPVIGYQEVIQGLSRDDIFSYYKLAYQPSNIVFSIAGDRPPEEMLQAVQRFVSEVKPGREFSHELPTEPPVLSPRTVVATFPKLGQASLKLAFPSISLSHPDLYALDVLATVMGAGDSSILTEELRDKLGLVTGVSAGSGTPHWGDGSFDISMTLAPKNIEAATKATMEIIERIKKEGIDANRLQRAQTQMRVGRVQGLQTAEAIASSLAGDFMSTGDPHFSDRYIESVQRVTVDQVKIVAQKYLNEQVLLTTALLPAEFVGADGLPKAVEVLRPTSPTTAVAEATTQPTAETKRVVLKNGTVLLLKRVQTSPIVSVNMYALGGLTAEDASTNGIGNLAMELAPRGTKTRSARQIAEFFDSIGGSINAGCGNNTWFWNATFLNSDFDRAIEVYADVVNNPTFTDAELAQMKPRIGAAIESQDADWTNQAFRFFKSVYYAPVASPYQFQTIGTRENLDKVTRQQVAEWYGKTIQPSPRVLAVYGDIDVVKTQAIVEKLLGEGAALQLSATTLPSTTEAVAVQVAPSPVASVQVREVKVQPTEQPVAGIVIGFDSASVIGDPMNFPLVVGDTMASGFAYPTGYLHEILRGRGLVYIVHAMNSPGRPGYPGTFVVYAGCDPKNVNEVVETILENIGRLQSTLADNQSEAKQTEPDAVGWFDRSKRLITTSDAMDNETAAEQATTAALDELYGLGYKYHSRFAETIDAVKFDGVREAARSRLSTCVVTVSTPAPDLVQVKPGLRKFDTFPPVDLTPRGVQHDTGMSGN